jgi:hypothetical protein
VDGLDVSRGSCVYAEVDIPLYSVFGCVMERSCQSGAFHRQLMYIPYFSEVPRAIAAREEMEG